ncbi:hypothetical protein [Streptomyces sp. NPDC002851]
MSTNSGLGAARYFRAAGQETLGILADLIEQEHPVFAMPSWFITEESAKSASPAPTAPASPSP